MCNKHVEGNFAVQHYKIHSVKKTSKIKIEFMLCFRVKE